jgi:acetyl-CoA carboxylase biotin carboxylase subunit
MFKKILIANRGEIALRVIRACREMGIKTVAVHSTADNDAMYVKMADESVCIGPASSAESYLKMSAIISAAVVTNADAVHPGYGFLSENAEFAEMLEAHGIEFIGPTPEHIRRMGDKVEAKRTAIELGIPVVPGSKGALNTISEALKTAKEIGYPVIVKAASGGGGRGMKIAFNDEELKAQFPIAKSEAKVAFGDDRVYMEKYLVNPKHIEIQLIGDKFGNVVTLGERDCSMQRKNQKIIEEAPASILTKKQSQDIQTIVRKAMEKLKYRGAGTIEFLFENGEFYFMEMNTRLQVEHPVTEQVYEVDLVREQIRVAEGQKLSFKQEDIYPRCHALECRINAEDPETFVPFPGTVKYYHAPGGFGVRVDSGLYSGYKIPSCYDSMIAKVITFAPTREGAITKMYYALSEMIVDGVKTSIPLQQELLMQKEFKDGTYPIHWLQDYIAEKSKAKEEAVEEKPVQKKKKSIIKKKKTK